jgi:hypothetical protein
MLQAKFVEEIKTHILCSVTFFYDIVSLLENMEKYVTAGEATDNSMTHAH